MLPAARRLRLIPAASTPGEEEPVDAARPPPAVVLPVRRGRKEFADHGAFALYALHCAVQGGLTVLGVWLAGASVLRAVEILAAKL